MYFKKVYFENKTSKYTENSFAKKTLPIFYVFIIVISIGICYFYYNNLKKEEVVHIQSISIEDKEVTIKYGETYEIKTKINPENATNKNIMWSSSNPSLVKVDTNGKIYILKNENGEAIITGKTNEGTHKVELKLTTLKVENIIPVTNLEIEEEINLKYGETKNIKFEVLPENATNKTIQWSSSDPNVLSIKDGVIKTNSNIDAQIIITAKTHEGNIEKKVKVNLTKIEIKQETSQNTTTNENKDNTINVTGITVKEKEITLKYGEKYKIEANVLPTNATNQELYFTSNDPFYVSVDNKGNINIKINKDGEVDIKISTPDNKYTTKVKIKIKKINTKVSVTGLKVEQSNITLKYNETKKINTEIEPANATNKNLIWTSENTSLLTVDNQGNITAKSGNIGIAKITVKTEDGNFSKTINVKILPSGNAISFIGNKNYSNYKVNMLLYRTNSVMQNFALLNNNLYISQGQLSSLQGAYISKINMNEVTNNVNTPQKFQSSTAILNNYGHADALDIETTNGVNYLWTDCYYETSPATHCRIKLNDIKFSSEPYANNNLNVSLKVSGPNMVAVDSDNRTLVFLNATTTKEHTFVVYNLDDYILNKDKAKVISEFKVTNSVYSISRQGIDVYGNYIYTYEGNATNLDKKHVVYVSVHTLDGETIVYRKPIDYPDNIYYWEPEGIKIQNNNIYIGFAKIDEKAKQKTANIYKLN